MKTQMTSTILGLVLGLASGLNFAWADESFLDDFSNPDPTNPDREPVAWTLRYGNDIIIENENLIIWDVPNTGGALLAGAFVDEFTAQDVSLEAEFRILEGTNAGVCFLPTGVCGHVSTSVSPWPLKAMLSQWESILADAPVGFDASEEDVVVRLQTLGDQLSLWVWPADGIRPDEPLVTATKPAGSSHRIGVVVDNGLVGGTESRTVFRYFQAQVIPPLPGDFDKDGDLDKYDINSLQRRVRGPEYISEYDLNYDGSVDRMDVDVWVQEQKNTWYGDANLNGEFNSTDLVEVFDAGKFEKGWMDDEGTIHNGAGWQDGDWNADGMFDSGDMVKAFVDGGYEKGPRADAVAVPEPGGWVLLVIGFALWLLGRRTG